MLTTVLLNFSAKNWMFGHIPVNQIMEGLHQIKLIYISL